MRALVALSLLLAGCGGRVTDLDADAGSDSGADAIPGADADAIVPPPFGCPASRPSAGTPCSGTVRCKYGACPPGPVVVAQCTGGRFALFNEPCGDPPPPPPPTGTTGNPCASDDECDLTGEGINLCARGLFSDGSVYPNPVCIGIECDPGGGTTPARCDGERGLCLPTSTSGDGICLPACTYAGDGFPPKGCIGKNACFPYFNQPDPMVGMKGVGFCLGGCTVDADCAAAGERCQVETGYCVRTVVPYTKKLGEKCTEADVEPPAKCNCMYEGGSGYCTVACRTATSSCPTGFWCDAQLPPTFGKVPAGLLGSCLKSCTTDADCPAGRCEQHAGVPGKTCGIGFMP